MMTTHKVLEIRDSFFGAGGEDGASLLCTVEDAGTEDMMIRLGKNAGDEAILLLKGDWNDLLAFVAEEEQEAE